MTDTQTTENPAAIERDIRRTQDDMSRTVDKIGDQMTPKSLFNALLDKADENGIDARYLVEGARRNPMALGLIAAGAIWLVSDKDSKFPSIGDTSKNRDTDEFDLAGSDVHHRDYVSHMSSLEMRDGEEPRAYQNRRDMHRASFLMCERKPDEDDGSFRQRLDDMTDQFRDKRRAWSDSASEMASGASQKAQAMADSAQQTARQASDRAQQMYDSNPLIGGILAAAVGAALGSAIPVSRQEQEKLGGMGAKALDAAEDKTEQLTSKARAKADDLTQTMDDKLQQTPQSGSRQADPHSQQNRDSGSSSGSDNRSSSEGPFIISDRSM